MAWKSVWRVACVAGGLGLSGAAGAHEVVCKKDILVDGYGTPMAEATVQEGYGQKTPVSIWSIDTYPATVTLRVRIDNVSEGRSEVLAVDDALMKASGYEYTPYVPFWLEKGGYWEQSYTVYIADYDACLYLAKQDYREDASIDSVFSASWDKGEAQCSARLKCKAPAPAYEPDAGAGGGYGDQVDAGYPYPDDAGYPYPTDNYE